MVIHRLTVTREGEGRRALGPSTTRVSNSLGPIYIFGSSDSTDVFGKRGN